MGMYATAKEQTTNDRKLPEIRLFLNFDMSTAFFNILRPGTTFDNILKRCIPSFSLTPQPSLILLH